MDPEKRARRQSLRILISECFMVVAVVITVAILAFVVSGYWVNSDFKVERNGMVCVLCVCVCVCVWCVCGVHGLCVCVCETSVCGVCGVSVGCVCGGLVQGHGNTRARGGGEGEACRQGTRGERAGRSEQARGWAGRLGFWESHPRSLSPLERNIGFWTQA